MVKGKEERQSGRREREKVTAKGDVTRIVVSGSRTSEIEPELLSADVEDRRVTKDAAIAGSECTGKAMEVSTKNEAERKYSSVDEEVSRVRKAKERREPPPLEISCPRWKGSLSCVNILKKLGKSRVPRESTHRRRKEEM